MNTPFAKKYLLVDGYNIIFAWDSLKSIAKASLEASRYKLIDILANYRAYKRTEVIIVFDAHKVEGGVGSISKYNGINVVYTREAETADEYIERVTGELVSEGRIRVTVATSDSMEQMIILGKGAFKLNAAEFQNEVRETEDDIRYRINTPKPVKKNLLFDYLDPKTAAMLEKIRRSEGEL